MTEATPITSLTVSYAQINEATEALKALDERNEKKDRRFKFDNLVRLGLAARLRRLTDVLKDFTDIRKEIVEEFELTTPVDEATEKSADKVERLTRVNKANEKIDEASKATVDLIGFRKVKVADLALDKNEIDGAVIASMWWLLDEIPAELAEMFAPPAAK